MAFTLPALPYAHEALEPHIDTTTMQIHHGKHHQAYVDNLNKAIAGTENENRSLADLVNMQAAFLRRYVITVAATGTTAFFGKALHLMEVEHLRVN